MKFTEKEVIKALNASLVSEASRFVRLFHAGLMVAVETKDLAQLEQLAKMAEKYRDKIAAYIDTCGECQDAM